MEVIRTTRFEMIPTHQIARLSPTTIKRGKVQAEAYELYGADGSLWGVAWAEAVTQALGRLVPASPGWSVLTTVVDEKRRPQEVWRDPVVAWLVEPGLSSPVTLEGVLSEGDSPNIERPDGWVEVAFSATWPDADAWLQEKQKTWDLQSRQESA